MKAREHAQVGAARPISPPPARRARVAVIVLSTAVAFGGLAACKREERAFRVSPAAAGRGEGVRLSELQPGQRLAESPAKNDYEGNAHAMAEGKRLFQAFNCVGCHANGGGGIGPALIDERWRYGSESAQIFATIMQGRPNGMPSYRGKLNEDQAWRIAAYVRSMSGLVSQAAAPSRDDHMKSSPPPNSVDPVSPRPEAAKIP